MIAKLGTLQLKPQASNSSILWNINLELKPSNLGNSWCIGGTQNPEWKNKYKTIIKILIMSVFWAPHAVTVTNNWLNWLVKNKCVIYLFRMS